MLHRFWKYGEEDRWGKRRQPRAVVPFWVDNQLESATRQAQSSHGADAADRLDTLLPIGLDILGPGGGQWQVLLQGDRLADMEKGLPSEAAAVLRISADNWQRLFRLSKDEAVRQLSGNLEILNGVPAEPLAGWLYGALFPRAAKTDQVPASEVSC
jgi:hypothetical protein